MTEHSAAELTIDQAVRARCLDLAIAYAERIFEINSKDKPDDQVIVDRARLFEAYIVGGDQ